MEWTLDECKSLVQQVLENTGARNRQDKIGYVKRIRHFKFSAIIIPGKSDKEIEEKVRELMEPVRKQRTLTEMFEEIKEDFTKSPKRAFERYLCKLEKPQMPAIVFMKRQSNKARKKGEKDLITITRNAMKKFHKLPDERKKKLLDSYHEEVKKYRNELEKQATEFSTPSIHGLARALFITRRVSKRLAKHPDADKEALEVKYISKWDGMDVEARVRYFDRADECMKNAELALKVEKVEKVENSEKEKKTPETSNTPAKAKGEGNHRATSLGCFIKDYMSQGHTHVEAQQAWKTLPDDQRLAWKDIARERSGKAVIKRRTKRFTAWSLFVKKHLANGGTFQTAGGAFHSLSEKKKRKLDEKAKQLNEEEKAKILSNGISPPPSGSQSPDSRKAEKKELVKTEIESPAAKKPKTSVLNTNQAHDTSNFIQSETSEGLTMAGIFRREPAEFVNNVESDFSSTSDEMTDD